MKKIILIIGVFICTCGVKAKEFSTGADIVSSYVWRGTYQGGGVNIQPSFTFSTGNFSIGTWGSSNCAGGKKEVDLIMSYRRAGFSLSVTDYWWEGEDALNYFNYKEEHLFEVGIGYFFHKLFPLNLSWNTVLVGAHDKSKEKQVHSTYIETSYPFTLKDINLEAAVGFTPWNNSILEIDNFAITNISLKASKIIPISEHFSLPLFGQIVLNPHKEDVFFVLGVSF